MGTEEGDLLSRAWRAGVAECLVHLGISQVEVRALFLKAAAGKVNQVWLRYGPGKPAACLVDACLNQDVQRWLGSCRVVVSAQ